MQLSNNVIAFNKKRGCFTITNNIDVQTIESVVKQGLCTGCGTCVSICPTKAITLTINMHQGIYLPNVDSSKCNHCSLCYSSCPGESVNFRELSKKMSPPLETSKHNSVLLGSYLNCYVGYATDHDVRFDSSSGGLVTQLLLFALQEGLIDGALVTRMKKDNPLQPEPFIARTAEEISDASKSKYCPVPANIAFEEILEHDGKYAVVGLPCHIHGLRKAQELNKKLRERIVFSIAIFCSHGDNFFQTYSILNRLNINPKNVKRIDYRGKGWPGKLTIELKSGSRKEIPYIEYVELHECGFFIPDRCLVCCDQVGELADFSCGDAWLPDFSADLAGTSLLISKNRESQKILKLRLEIALRLEPISADMVAKSQGNMRFKKNSYVVRSFLFRFFRRKVPFYDAIFPKYKLVDVARSLINSCQQKTLLKPLIETLEHLIALQNKIKRFIFSTV